ncbi:MAG: ComEA family DNA-binding protein [Phycisphaerales bacterium]
MNATRQADWTGGAAKFFAVGVLASLAALGLWLGLGRLSTGGPAAEASLPLDAASAGASVRAPESASPSSVAPVAGASLTSRIDLNAASRVELESLPGIGPALAGRIIESREQFGPFATVESLTRVKGIGPKTLDRLRPLVRVGEQADPAPKP